MNAKEELRRKLIMKRPLQKYCDYCEKVSNLTEDGYCVECGKHADNMNRKVEPSFV